MLSAVTIATAPIAASRPALRFMPVPAVTAPPPGTGHPSGAGPARPIRHYVVLAAFAAFAAAFISCLCARTLVSDSGPVMSATDRKDCGSP